MSNSTDSFIYEHPEKGKCEISYTAVAKQDGKEIAADLTSDQLEFIKKALVTEILLDVSKRHHLKISVLKEDSFDVTIDNKTKFFINVKANKEIVVIQEKIKKRDFFGANLTQFFKFIATLFYSPSFPDKSSKDRVPQEAVREDYSMLKRGLESGRAWLQPKKEILVSGTDFEQKNKLVEKVDQTIKHAGRIETALKSRNPQQSLDKLSSEWSNYLFNNLRDGEEFLIPVGYLNSDNSLEPIMLRFYKEKGVIRLEIYAESTEAGAKVSPIQLREFTGKVKRTQIAELLNTFFLPLVPLETKPLPIPQGLQTFEEIYRTKRDEELAKKGLAKKNVPALETDQEQKAEPPSHLTFESLLRALDNQMGGSWIALKSEELAKPSDSPAARVVKYFDHLLSQIGGSGISQNGKINLLYHLIEGWLESQESRIGKKTSEEKQLEIYEDCLKQLNHVINKIATAINDGHPLDPEWIPSHLKEKKKFYEQKIVELQKNRRMASIEMTDMFLETPLSGDLGLAIGSEIRRDKAEPPKIEPQKTLHLERWEKKWEDSLQALKALVSDERWTQYQGVRAAGELAAVLESHGLSWDDFSSDLQANKEAELVRNLIHSLLIENGDLERLINQAKADSKFAFYAKDVNQEFILEFAEALRQLILFPHLLPQYDQQKCPLPRAYFLTLAARFQDSELFLSGKNDDGYKALRALFGLRHLISQERRLEMEASSLRSQPETYLRIKKEQNADSNPNVVAIQQIMSEDAAQKNPFEQVQITEAAPSEIKDIESLKKASREYREEILNHISQLVQRCNELNEQAINEPNLERRKELLQQVREHALMALKIIPPPSIMGALGENSIWNDLDLKQALAASANVSRLEHLVWEVQMKLAETEIDGRDRFLVIKAQTIRQSIIHSQVRKVKAQAEDLLNNAYAQNKQMVENLIQEGVLELESGRLKINLPLASKSLGLLREKIKELIPEGGPLPPISFLAFENHMLDALSHNELLSQDLTARLSEDAELERDLESVYRFIIREYNAGVEDTIQSGEGRFRSEFRTPLFNNYRNLGLRPQGNYRPNPSNHLGWSILDNDPSRQFLEEMAESFYMYRTMSDPDFTLYTISPTLGVPYFQARPAAFLHQKELKIHITEHRVSDIVAIVGDGPENLAHVYAEGHPEFSNDAAIGEKNEEKISKKRSFLPLVDNKPGISQEIRLEQRIYRPLPVWLKYIEEVSKGESLLVPQQVLAALFLIRESPIIRDKSTSTSYSSETAIRALAFIIHPDNQKYLQYDFVQKYLEESLFGSFLMQQALLDHPESINSLIEPLIKAMEGSIEGSNDLAFGFLSNVLKQLTAHAKFTQESLTKEGWFSGLLMGTLPSHLGKYGGVFEQTLKVTEELTQDSQGHKLEVNAQELSPEQVSQPLLSRYGEIAKVAKNLDEASDLISLEERYFERNEKGYYIDQIKKLPVKKQMYTLAIESFKLADEPLNQEQLRHVLMGYELLLDPSIEVGDSLKEKRLVEWVRTIVLPQFHKLDSETKNAILTEITNAKLTRQKMEPIHGSWEQTKENPQVYRLISSGRNLEINIYNVSLSGIQASATKTQKFIPYSILAREDVRQALKADKILATETKQGKEVTYEWVHDGQKFKMILGERLIIERTFDVGTNEIEELTFTFQPIVVEDVQDSAHALMAENGFWIDETNQSGMMFTRGMELPNESTVYKVDYHHSPQGGMVIDHLKLVDKPNRLVSSSPKFNETSPLLFASNRNLIFILNEDKTTGEFRLKNSNINFRFDNSEQRWVCYRGSERMGIILYPKNEQAVENHFGDNWDQFVIPLFNDSGKSQYLLIPYNQEINNKGKAVADQDSFEEMDRIEFLKTDEDGLIKGSIASDLYLADRFIRQAAQTKNATAANALYLKAEKHLKRLKLAKPPSDPAELQRLNKIINAIKENPPVSMQKGVPSITALSLNLRLMLSVRKMREHITVPSQKVLLLSPAQDFEELESITKLYHGYQVLRKEASGEKLHKAILRLNEDEVGELQMISRQLIQEAAHLEGIQTYFGATGRLESPISLARPTELDPQFLLTLLRIAKKPESGKDIKKITGPLPLNDLLENFWSYFLSIREQQLEPDELIFLFSESILPPVKSAEEEAYLKKLDLQARQFLLVFADLQQALKQDPKETLEKELEAAKSKVAEVFGPQGELKDLLGILRKDLGLEAIQMAETFNQIQIISKEVQFGKKKMVLPDVEKLTTDVTELDSRLYQFVFSIKNVISEAKNFAESYRAEYDKIRKEISEIESNLTSESSKGKEKVSEEDEKWIHALEARKEILIKQLEDLINKKVNNPVNGEEITVEMVISGEFENAVQLENLEKFSNSCLQIHQSIQKNLENAKEAMQKLDLLIRLETAMGELQSKSFEPHPSLTFPSDPESTEKLKELITIFEKSKFREMSFLEKTNFLKKNSMALFRQMGIRKGFGLINQLVDYQQGRLVEKMTLFATPLEGLALLGAFAPITAGKKLPPSSVSLELEALLENPAAQQCFTASQLSDIRKKVATMQQAEKQSYLAKLSSAIGLSASTLSAQIALSANLSKIDQICRSLGILEPEELQIPLVPSKIDRNYQVPVTKRSSNFQAKYGGLFKGRNDFPADYSKAAELLEQKQMVYSEDNEEIKVITNGVNYLRKKMDPKQEDISRLPEKLQKHFYELEFLPIIGAVEVIAGARSKSPEAVAEIMQNIQEANNGLDLLRIIEEGHRRLAPKYYHEEHLTLVSELSHTLPGKKSAYTNDLEKGFSNLKDANPLPYSEVAAEDQIDYLKAQVKSDAEELRESLKIQEEAIIRQLKKIPVQKLPHQLQLIRFRNGSDQELLQAAYFQHSNAIFTSMDSELDKMISMAQIDATRLKLLTTAKFNALKSIDALKNLQHQRNELFGEYDQFARELKEALGNEKVKQKKIKNLREKQAAILVKIKAVDAVWLKESNRLKDCLDRCQSTEHLTSKEFPDRLKPHFRKIVYLQNKLGVVLRDDQIEALKQMVENPSLLLQMRMGLGKTSLLTPFIFSILAEEGYNVIGMVPKSQFAKNFDDMDETTRVVFEMAGKQFLFNREDAPKPFTPLVLQKISQHCRDFFTALENHEYILTTIESKASLDDKINEIEESQLSIQKALEEAKKQGEEGLGLVDNFYMQLGEHQIALDLLYRVKATFEHKNTRLIIDEADQVGRANYSVNSEIGIQEKPAPVIIQTAEIIFSIIQDREELLPLREQIYSNNQFTLKKESVDDFIQAIGRAWLEECQKKPGFPEALKDEKVQENILEWFAGEASTFSRAEFQEFGPFGNELKAMRKGLNQGLRASLALKIGLNADFDSIHFALGVPASQGVTSPTTKYSDPMMQLCLTNMVAMYKVQSEKFLTASVSQVMEQINREIGREVEPNPTLLAARQILINLDQIRQDGGVPNYEKALTGSEPEKVFLRLQFARQVAERKLIYISSGQISRAVQNALRGCNVIGLTGTATRNLTHVLSSNGNEGAMKNLDATGRQTTAEVVYRWVKSLPQGLKTPVQTYPSENTLAWFTSFAKSNSGYNFLINQAGICDTHSQKELVKALHKEAKRPIVFLDLETDKNSVMIHGIVKRMDELTEEEKKEIKEKGFYYYHTPHARGTHFDIPTGSKGALMLSPNVNASDRDQAAYRARELGEGHVVDPFISEIQSADIKASKPHEDQIVRLEDLLKAQHDKTLSDEEKENLAAYRLHITGQLILAADKAKKNLQLADSTGITQRGQWSSKKAKNEQVVESRTLVFELLKNYFVQESGNMVLLRKLDLEISQGGEAATQQSLQELVENEKKRGQRLIARLKEEQAKHPDNPLILSAIDETIRQFEIAIGNLTNESKRIRTDWSALKTLFSETTSVISTDQETAEVEADKESEEEKESEVETSIEKELYARRNAAKNILETLDSQTLDSIPTLVDSTVGVNGMTLAGIIDLNDSQKMQQENIWKPNVFVSPRLRSQIKGGVLPEMKVLIVKDGPKTHFLGVLDPWEGDHVTSSDAYWFNFSDNKLFNGGVFQVSMEPNGDLKLIYSASAPFMKGVSEEFQTAESQAEILISLIHLGITRLTDEQWGGIEAYWRKLGADERRVLQKSLETTLEKSNPSFLGQTVAVHLWNKPESIVSLGKPKEVSKDLDRAKNELDNHMKLFEKTSKEDKERQLERWLSRNASDELKDELEKYGKDKYVSSES